MRSRRKITLSIALTYLCSLITTTLANPGQLREERREYQFQRSSQLSGGNAVDTPRYHSQVIDNKDIDKELSNWKQRHMEEVNQMAEKLRDEYNTATSGGSGRAYVRTTSYLGQLSSNGGGCISGCAQVSAFPYFTGKTKEELDEFTKEMTYKILSEMNSGMLQQSQVNQPHWFEHRVAQTLEEMERRKQEQPGYQNNYRNEGHYSERQEGQHVTYPRVTGSSHHRESNQHREETVHEYLPSTIATTLQTHNRERQEVSRTAYVPPVQVPPQSTHQSRNYTSMSQTSSSTAPQYGWYNQNGERLTESEVEEYRRTQLPVYPYSYFQRTQNEDRSTNYNYRPQLPTQTSRTSTHFQEETRETMRQPRPTMVTQTQNTREQRERVVETRTETPKIGHSSHSIYSHLRESEGTVPNYRPRVVIQNTQFHEMERQNENKGVYIPVQPSISTMTRKEEERHHAQQGQYYPRPTSVMHQTHEEEIRQRESYLPTVRPSQTISTDQQHLWETESHRKPDYETSNSHTSTDSGVNKTHHEQTRHYVRPGGMTVVTERNETRIRARPGQTVHIPYQYERNEEQVQSGSQSRQPQHPQWVRTETEIYEEYTIRRSRLEDFITENGYRKLDEQELNSTISTGVLLVDGVQENLRFVDETSKWELNLSYPQYVERLRAIQEYLNERGFERLPAEVYNRTIHTNTFNHEDYRERVRYNPSERKYHLNVNYEEYAQRWGALQTFLGTRGYEHLSEDIYNKTIHTGAFEYDGTREKLRFNSALKKYEVELNVYDMHDRMIALRDFMSQQGYPSLSEDEYKTIVTNGMFTHGEFIERLRYINVDKKYQRILTQEEYEQRHAALQRFFKHHAYEQIPDEIFKQTVYTGSFNFGDFRERVRYNPSKQEYELYLDSDEISRRSTAIQHYLLEKKFDFTTQIDYNTAIYTGELAYGQHLDHIRYNSRLAKFEQILRHQDYAARSDALKEFIAKRNFININDNEFKDAIYQNKMTYDGYQYVLRYDGANKRYIYDISDAEYAYRRIDMKDHYAMREIDNPSEHLLNETIFTGAFEDGGFRVLLRYNYETRKYELDLLQEEYQRRMRILKDYLLRRAFKGISETSYKTTMDAGMFVHERYREKLRYNENGHKFEQDINNSEYNERLVALKYYLRRRGLGDLGEDVYRETIYSNIFMYGGYKESLYFNRETRKYERIGDNGQIIEDDQNAGGIGGEIGDAHYASTNHKEDAEPGLPNAEKRKQTLPHKNRGDQPPQHFEDDDYEDSEEVLEQEPGIGYYPNDNKPAPIIQSTPAPVSPTRPVSRPVAPYVPRESPNWPGETAYERHYKRTKTTYTVA